VINERHLKLILKIGADWQSKRPFGPKSAAADTRQSLVVNCRLDEKKPSATPNSVNT
jgi:hypothetical protein